MADSYILSGPVPTHKELLSLIAGNANPPIKDYILPGLNSTMLGTDAGVTVRLFDMTRDQHTGIVPHSHRFDLCCLVLRGWVRNTLWTPGSDTDDMYTLLRLAYGGQPGVYPAKARVDDSWWKHSTRTYRAGDSYAMTHDQIHSIEFSKNAAVLIFEGRPVADYSAVLEPFVDGSTIPTLKTEPWMFRKTDQ